MRLYIPDARNVGLTNASQIHLRYDNIQHINYYLVFSWMFSVGDGMRGAFYFGRWGGCERI